MKTLLTGFNSFGDLKVNPSQIVVESLAKRLAGSGFIDLVSEVLPTEYVAAEDRIIHLIRQNRPDSVLCLGAARNIESIHLERVALNLDDAKMPDNAGLSRSGNLITSDGPPAYWSTLPIEEMCEELKQRGIPAIISNYAGAYICNHVFYLARHEVEISGIGSRCGFIHLPPFSEPMGTETQSVNGLALKVMLEAVECCIQLLNK